MTCMHCIIEYLVTTKIQKFKNKFNQDKFNGKKTIYKVNVVMFTGGSTLLSFLLPVSGSFNGVLVNWFISLI